MRGGDVVKGVRRVSRDSGMDRAGEVGEGWEVIECGGGK